MSHLDAKEKILNVSEKLFAGKGFHNTSLRDITADAEVNLAAVNYHFGSKEALLQSVIERRLLPLNRARLERLEQVRERAVKKGKKPQVRDVMRAFIEPTFRFMQSGPEAGNFTALIGRALSEPEDTVRRFFFRLIWPLFLKLFETLAMALPHLPKDILFWRLQFALGSITHTLHIYQKSFPEYPEFMKIISETDIDSLIEMILNFVTPGMENS